MGGGDEGCVTRLPEGADLAQEASPITTTESMVCNRVFMASQDAHALPTGQRGFPRSSCDGGSQVATTGMWQHPGEPRRGVDERPRSERNYLVRDHELNRRQDDTIDFVTELVFPDRAAYLAWGAAVGTGGPGEQVAADEARFLDRSRTRAYVIEEHVTTG